MSSSTPAPNSGASPEEIEADIAATRARLAGSVDALADKIDVKARAQEKVADVKSGAQEKVAEVKAEAQHKAAEGQQAAVSVYHQVRARYDALPQPARVAVLAVPAALVLLAVVRGARG